MACIHIGTDHACSLHLFPSVNCSLQFGHGFESCVAAVVLASFGRHATCLCYCVPRPHECTRIFQGFCRFAKSTKGHFALGCDSHHVIEMASGVPPLPISAPVRKMGSVREECMCKICGAPVQKVLVGTRDAFKARIGLKQLSAGLVTTERKHGCGPP